MRRSRLRNWDSKISFFVFADIITGVSGILIFVTLMLATDLGNPVGRASQSANPTDELHLQDILRQQLEADARNRTQQELLAAAETAPAVEKIEGDIALLRTELSEAQRAQSAAAAKLAGSQADILARDKTLGLVGLKGAIQRTVQETDALTKQDAKARSEMASLEQQVARAQSQLLNVRQREGQLWLIPDKTTTTKEPILVTASGAGVTIERFDNPAERRQLDKAGADSAFDSYLRDAKPLDRYVVFLVKPSGIQLFEGLSKSAHARGFEVGFMALEESMQTHFAAPPSAEEPAPTTNAPATAPNQEPTASPGAAQPSANNPTVQTTTNSPSGAPHAAPAPQKSKSWWQRLLERIGLS